MPCLPTLFCVGLFVLSSRSSDVSYSFSEVGTGENVLLPDEKQKSCLGSFCAAAARYVLSTCAILPPTECFSFCLWSFDLSCVVAMWSQISQSRQVRLRFENFRDRSGPCPIVRELRCTVLFGVAGVDSFWKRSLALPYC